MGRLSLSTLFYLGDSGQVIAPIIHYTKQHSGRLLLLLFVLLLGLRPTHVRHYEEVCEQEEQRDDVVQVCMCDFLRIALTVRHQDVDRLGVHHHELNHLTQGEGGLPPNLLGMERYEVVRVHHRVDKTIQHDGQVDISVISHVDIQPVEL